MKKSSKVTMGQIAKETGFSMATVSHVVNKTRHVDQQTKEVILDAIERLNYTRKISSLPQDSKLIGMVIADIREDFYIELIKAAEVSAMENGYSLILCDAEDDAEREQLHVHNLLERDVSGIIIAPINQYHVPDLLENLEIPVICIDRCYQNARLDSVTINNFEASRKLTENLVKKGVDRLGFIGYADSVYTAAERKNGYVHAMESFLLEPNVLQIPYYQEKMCQRDIVDFIREDRFSLVCATSHICFEAMGAAKEIYGRVPENFHIGTFDENKWFHYIETPLTVVKQPTIEMGIIAVELLVNRIGKNFALSNRIEYRKNIVLDIEIIAM